MSADRLLSRLTGVLGKGPRWRALCPVHKSQHKTRTLAIREAEDGRLLVHCFAGCAAHEVIGAVGLTMESLMPSAEGKRELMPFGPLDALLCIEHEVDVATRLILVASKGELRPDQRLRLAQAAELINSARSACGLRQQNSARARNSDAKPGLPQRGQQVRVGGARG